MFDRLWWFATGALAGGVVTVRALRRRPRPADLRVAAAHTGADVLDLAARVVRPSGTGREPEAGSRNSKAASQEPEAGSRKP